MKLLNWFTPRNAKTTVKSNRTILGLNALEARDVPAAFNLTTVGATATVNGAIFSQYNAHAPENAANGPVSSFLRMDTNGVEEGYNTDGRLQFDEARRSTHSIKVSDLPLVTKGGVQYRELILDANEPRRQSLISLDELRVYVSNNPNLRNYNQRTNTIGGVAPVYDLDAGPGNNYVRIDAALNNQTGTGDMTLDIPADLLSGGTYLTLYSKFGGRNSSGGGYEQWGPGFVTVTPPSTQVHFNVTLQQDNSGNIGPTQQDVTIVLRNSAGDIVYTATVGAGVASFSFDADIAAAGIYTLSAFSSTDLGEMTFSVSLDLEPGDTTTQNIVIAFNE